MAKEKDIRTDLEKAQEQIAILQQKIADQDALREAMVKVATPNLSSEMQKINRKNQSGGNVITVREKNDHTNIRLWTRDGQPLGPFHPDNAIQILNLWASHGIYLTVDRPTQAQVEAYCATPEYKELQRKEKERRAVKDKSKRRGNLERLTAEIAKQTGVISNFVLDKANVKQ